MKAWTNDYRARRGGVLVKLLLVLGMLFAFGAILWVTLLPGLVASRIHDKTGFGVKVDTLSVNPFTAEVVIKGLVLKNPDGWPVEEFVDLREFRAEANLLSLISGRLVVQEAVIDLAQVTLVKNQQGLLNAAVFNQGLAANGTAGQSGPGGTRRQFLIKHLVLKTGKLVYVDHSRRKPVRKEYTLNLNRDLRDVDSMAKIVTPVTGSAVGETIGGIFVSNPDTLKDVTGALQDAGRRTGEKLKGLLDSLDKKRP